MDGDFVEEGGAYPVFRQSGAYWIEAHRREDIPCRHLARIVIACQTSRDILIFGVHDMPYPLGSLIRPSDCIV